MKNIITGLALGAIMLLSSTSLTTTPATIKVDVIDEIKQEATNELSEDEIIKEMLKREYDENSMYDIAGIIYIEDIVLDVVMMPTDNDDYLYADREGDYDREGELFLSDLANFKETKSLDMTRIYGHNMGSGRKFGLLDRLHHYDNGRPMYFYDGEKTTKYNIARSFKFVDGSDTFERYDLTDEQKKSYLESVTGNYVVSHVEEFDPTKDVVFLQTCQTATGLLRDVVTYIEDGVI